MDNKLNWKGQCAAALAKGQDWLIQFNRLAKTSQGIQAKYTQQLYLSIAIPCMFYAADISLTLQQNAGSSQLSSPNNWAVMNKMASIQHRAAIMITGAMKTTATDILELMANLLPFWISVDKICYRAAIRLTMLHPHTHCTNQYRAQKINLWRDTGHHYTISCIDTNYIQKTWKPSMLQDITQTVRATADGGAEPSRGS